MDVLHKQEERLSNQVEAVSTKIAKDVNEHYGDFVQGMRNITELTDGLEQSFVIVNNGRRNISFARKRGPCDESRRVTHAEESPPHSTCSSECENAKVWRREYAQASRHRALLTPWWSMRKR